MPQIAIIADDLTGAVDAGAPFARAGLLTLLATLSSGLAAELLECDVLAISTESRHESEEKAAAKTRLAAMQIQQEGRDKEVRWLYKKIDSTLRGHPHRELAAVMDTSGFEQALVAPAFPAQGRTTIGGRQLVQGTLVEHTPFGREVVSSDLLTLFKRGPGKRLCRLIELSTVQRGQDAVCEELNGPEPAVVIGDAETDADLVTLARAALACRVRLLCGSAGLARALADLLPASPRAPTPEFPRCSPGSVLVVAGSRHPRTICQVKTAHRRGAALLRPELTAESLDDRTVERTVESAARHLARGQAVILTTIGLDDSPLGTQTVATTLSDVARELVADQQVGRLVLTGGDIAAAVCDALGVSGLWLRGEIEPGVVWAVLLGGLLPGLPVITKAGGFGADNALAEAIGHPLDCA